MSINDEELLAAVSSGIDNEGAAPAAATADQQEATVDEQVSDGADDSSDGNADAAAAGADDGTVADAATDPDKSDGDETEPELDADGKPVAKQAKAKDEPAPEVDPATGKPFTPEQLAAKKAKEDFAKSQVEDPVNAPIPKYLKETTQKRMTKLVEIAKDLTTKHQAAENDRNEIIGMITDTGATATQYTSALQYLKMVNSRDPVQIKQAIGVMQQELAALSRMAGVAVPGVDHLANHADLKTAVDAKQITQELAEEIAAGREQRTFQTHQSQAAQQSAQQVQQEHAAGVAALNDIGKQLAARDPNYRAKAVAVLNEIRTDMEKLPPRQWAQAFLVAYTTHKPAIRTHDSVARKAVPAVPKNQPLRGNNPSGGQQGAPKSLEEAINFGIAAGTRR